MKHAMAPRGRPSSTFTAHPAVTSRRDSPPNAIQAAATASASNQE